MNFESIHETILTFTFSGINDLKKNKNQNTKMYQTANILPSSVPILLSFYYNYFKIASSFYLLLITALTSSKSSSNVKNFSLPFFFFIKSLNFL